MRSLHGLVKNITVGADSFYLKMHPVLKKEVREDGLVVDMAKTLVNTIANNRIGHAADMDDPLAVFDNERDRMLNTSHHASQLFNISKGQPIADIKVEEEDVFRRLNELDTGNSDLQKRQQGESKYFESKPRIMKVRFAWHNKLSIN